MDDVGGGRAVLTIRVVGETGSTNADLLAAAAAGAAEGNWLRAERQTAGRGRQGRPWIDGAGNLFASTIVRLRPGDPPAPSLALVAGVALAEVIEDIAPGLARIKWPNDLMVGTAKLAGMLLERGTGDAVVAGFGVNVGRHPDLPDRTTTSLAAQGLRMELVALLDGLTATFAARLSDWRASGMAVIRQRWLALAHPVGTPLTARLAVGRTAQGRFDGLEPSGALRLKLPDGAVEIIHAGDVFL
ncbi:biotin--[acetyl-CoA-carboxylase] ligase [Sphingomonas sp. CFBP 13720]|uniref:biotin--[acetyl-CoA-carboxylase] ligase n=1 Tax=Sphingomonas sp. CFBP 13720 TaxID=2775302 RepID=UPI0017820248|nr:biotin--[acetyl-CoA-carboxylase] ligase [Sphingomonas sp. CFBP 13720]MBD8679032.1 biotin--[acetyl-CoA-carboxylase] ligase [Sphingomonas sp. CFBP 13720]